MIEAPPELDQDSDDLSDQEIESAIPIPSVNKMIVYLRGVQCGQCQKLIEVAQHSLRRRAPYFYARMRVQCPEGHEQQLVFRADWLQLLPGGVK